jgi:hypothetical protein
MYNYVIFVKSAGFLGFDTNGQKFYTLQIYQAKQYKTLEKAKIDTNCVLNTTTILQVVAE